MKRVCINKDEIRKKLGEILSPKRYQHTLGVVKAAKELAGRYGADIESAEIAALFHDYCKNMNLQEYEDYISRYGIVFDEISYGNRELMHGRIARYIAEKEYGVYDEDILNAVEYHTTGRKQMSLLEKVIALADYIEEGRGFPGAEEIRRIAKEDIDRALLFAMEGTLRHLIEKNQLIHIDTIEARNSLIRQIKTEVYE